MMSNIKCACTNKDTCRPIWKNFFDGAALESKYYAADLEERRHYRDHYTVVQPSQGGCSNTVKTKEHPEYKQIVQWKREET